LGKSVVGCFGTRQKGCREINLKLWMNTLANKKKNIFSLLKDAKDRSFKFIIIILNIHYNRPSIILLGLKIMDPNLLNI
jgi:hypothetical protein